jgi:hypothetical protein
VPQDEVEALELARDLGAQVATELPTVAGPELAQRLGPFPAPEPFDLSRRPCSASRPRMRLAWRVFSAASWVRSRERRLASSCSGEGTTTARQTLRSPSRYALRVNAIARTSRRSCVDGPQLARRE